jgi:hypothetical protein
MNSFRSSAALLLAGTLALAAQDSEIHCGDGSRIRGELLAIQPDRLIFGADFLAKPVPLRLDQVLEISLPVHQAEPQGDHVATVTLSNGDILRGELTGVDADSIRLRTWYAGELGFRRSMVDALEIEDRPEILYHGPHGLDGWTQESPDTWTFEQGSLRAKAPGTIARELKLPTKVRFAFDLAWRSSPRFRFLFFTDDIKSENPNNAYELICQGRYIQLQKRWSAGDRGGSTTLGDFANAPDFLSKEKSRVEILADRKAGTFRLLVNGRIIKDWSDPEPDTFKPGGGIHFHIQETAPLRISRIEVSTWDGILEGNAPPNDEGFMGEEDAPAPESEESPDPARIRLRNNDKIAGELLGIDHGKVKIKTTFGDLSLPVSRLRTFALRKPEDRSNWERYEIPKIYNGDIRAWFPDGSRVTFRLIGAESGRLKGTAQPFGEADFDQKAFTRIEFNLYDPDLDRARGAALDW